MPHILAFKFYEMEPRTRLVFTCPIFKNVFQLFSKVLLTNTTVRLEYVPTVAPKGLALELRVGKISYAGEAVNSDTSMTNR